MDKRSVRGERCTKCGGTRWCLAKPKQPLANPNPMFPHLKRREPRNACMEGRQGWLSYKEARLLLVLHAEGKYVDPDRLRLAAARIRESIDGSIDG